MQIIVYINDLLTRLHSCTDMPHDTDYPYPIRILAVFKVIRPYSILIRILTKFTETLFLTTLCPCMRHKTTAKWNKCLLLVTK